MSTQERVQAPKGVRMFREPMLVRHGEATRFLWGDAESQQVNDIIYGRNERIACLYFSLRPGGFFRSSKTWKALFDQHRFYYVVQGRLAIQDPERGDVAVAEAGEEVDDDGGREAEVGVEFEAVHGTSGLLASEIPDFALRARARITPH